MCVSGSTVLKETSHLVVALLWLVLLVLQMNHQPAGHPCAPVSLEGSWLSLKEDKKDKSCLLVQYVSVHCCVLG